MDSADNISSALALPQQVQVQSQVDEVLEEVVEGLVVDSHHEVALQVDRVLLHVISVADQITLLETARLKQ